MNTLNQSLEMFNLTDQEKVAQVLKERVHLKLRLGHYPGAMYVNLYLH